MGISVKESAIPAIIVECILYGISIFLFGITVWSLTYQRKSAEVSRSMLVTACLLFLLGTMHVVVDAIHLWQGFISSEGADQFFDDVSKYTFKNAIYELETLVGDAILIYRCYIVWQRIEVIIIPIIGWLAVAVTATHTVWSISQLSLNSDSASVHTMQQWLFAFYLTAIVTNFIATSYDPSTVASRTEFTDPYYLGTLALKLWLIHRHSSRLRSTGSQVYPILFVIMECGALYSLSLITMVATYFSGSNGSFVVLDMIGQFIPITFCLIIVRTAMLRFSERTGQGLFLSTVIWPSDSHHTARRMKAHVNRMAVVDTDIEFSSPDTDIMDDTYDSRSDNCLR
ncbi:hypothetical protein AZE42_10147 [Rhizopogon vesiculosus]|uniref:Uncharacterized protein n=1 Tax=Rhizopogon vesiculosus TaxID=180088 RepID=A0A1J8QP33_9AGAM|nr:hypothetical protein AZE42_10147 [Rhizopogon vesiculosus]